MTYKLIFQQEPTYLHAIVAGINSKETVAQYLEDVRSECIARNCFRVLVEEHLEGPRLEMMEVFNIVSHGSARAVGLMYEIAYVDVNAQGPWMKFAETVAANRALRVAVFSTVAEAAQWLMTPESDRARSKGASWSSRPA